MLFAAGVVYATPPLTVDIIANNPDSYIGDKIQVEGVLAGDVLSKPFFYASYEAAKAGVPGSAMDPITEDAGIRKLLHVAKPTCVILTGIFNIPGKDGKVSFGFEGFGYLMIESVRPCSTRRK